MTLYRTLTRAAGLGLCVVAFAGTALADPGKGNGEPAVTPPGQEKKAEQAPAPAPTPAPAAAKGQEQKAENQKKQATKKAAKATAKAAPKPAPSNKGQAKKAEKQAKKPAKTSGSFKNTSSGTNEKKPDQTHRHTICHATGSSSNPYVRITPSLSGVFNGHMGHQDGEDIVPPATYKGASISQNWDSEGQAIFNAGCEVPTPPAVQVVAPKTEQKQEEKKECPTTTTTTERVLVGVWHATGAMKNGQRKFVFITPSLASAHYDSSKHEDDIPVYDERTVTVTASAESCKQVATVTPPAPTPPVVPPTPEQPQPVVPTPPGETPAPGTIGVLPAVTPAPAGGVAGAVSPAPAEEKESGGVLGAVASAPEAVAETVTSGTLPFTGIPLWIAALIGGGLLAAGLALRRTA